MGYTTGELTDAGAADRWHHLVVRAGLATRLRMWSVGPFVWHKHDETDDFFLVISGRLTIHLRDRDIELEPGEIFVVPRGAEHCPDAEDAEILLIEPDGTVNTGDAGGEMTTEARIL